MNLKHAKFITLLCMIITFIGSYSHAEEETTSFKSIMLEKKSISETEIKNYTEKAKELDLDNWNLNSEKEWIEQKILTIQDQGRTVPEDLLSAKKSFEEKIKLNNNKIQRYKTLIVSHRRSLKLLNSKIKEHFSGKIPAWWKNVPRKNSKMVSKVDNVNVETVTVENMEKVQNSTSGLENRIMRDIERTGLNKDWVEIVNIHSGLVLKMTLPILFASGKTEVKPYYKKVFSKLAGVLKKYKVFVTVEGFTDPKKISTEKYPSNYQLGAGRAAKVVSVFVKSGMNPSKFTIISRGSYGTNAMSDANRRRASVTVYFKDQMGNMSEKRIKSEGINYLRISG